MDQTAIRRHPRGRAKQRPQAVVGDKGYTGRTIRGWCKRRGIRAVIPRLANERVPGYFDRALYRERNRIERFFNRCKQWRRLATRYDKLAETYRAWWLIACLMLWL